MNRVVIADSSALIPLDRRGELHLLGAHEVFIPPAVGKELVDDALKTARDLERISLPLSHLLEASASRFKELMERGQITVHKIDYIKYSGIIDETRRRLGKLDVKKEHRVKKGDCEIVALCQQFIDNGYDVTVLCEDRHLKEGVFPQLVPDVKVISFKEFLNEI